MRSIHRPRRSHRNPMAKRIRSGAVLVLAMALVFGGTAVGLAAVFNCPGGDEACLIDAINSANGTVAADTIILAAGTFTLTAVDNNTDGPNGLPSITSDITIQGAGALTTTIERDPTLGDEGPTFRILHVAASGTLTLEELTISGGFLQFNFHNGPGIFNAGGVLHITNSIVTDNTGIDFSLGGGVFNDTGGTLTIANSSITDNFCNNGLGGVAGIYNRGTAEITETTIDQNLGSSGAAAGILNSGTMTLVNSSVIRGLASFEGIAGIANLGGGTLTLKNCTVADNKYEDGFRPPRRSGRHPQFQRHRVAAEHDSGDEHIPRGWRRGIFELRRYAHVPGQQPRR